jgi:hypothetical protein
VAKARRYTLEQIIIKLREVEVLQSQGKNIEDAARKLEVLYSLTEAQVLIEMW